MSEPDPNVMLQIEVEAKIAHESSMVIDLGGALAREVIRLRSVVDALRVECDAYKKDADDTTKLLKFVQQEMHDLVQGKLRFEGKADLEALLLSAVTQRDEYKMRLEASQEILTKVVAERNQLRELVKASGRTVEIKVDQVEAAQVDALIKRRVLDARSPVADALLDFRDPPRTPRSCRLADLECELAAAKVRAEEAERQRDAIAKGVRLYRILAAIAPTTCEVEGCLEDCQHWESSHGHLVKEHL